MNKQMILKIIEIVLLILITRIIDVFIFTGVTEILWLVCGYIARWIWGLED